MFLFGFNRFIAPTVIKFFYYLSLFFTLLGGAGVVLYALAEAPNAGAPHTMALIAGALIGTPIAILFLRFSAEIWLVLFEINARLGQIRDKR